MSVRGACPGLHDPMESGDGWLARVRPRSARLDAGQARGLDRAARGFGNGHVELTSRGNLQVRGLSPASHPGFVRTVVGFGLGDADPVRERRGRIVAAPMSGADPLLAALEAGLAAEAGLDGLGAKFVFGFDAGAVSIATVGVDLLVGGGGRLVRAGDLEARVAQARCVEAVIGIARAFAATGMGRMRGLDVAARRALLVGAGLSPVTVGPVGAPPHPIGALGDGLVGCRPPFGAMRPGMLSEIADVAEHHGDGTILVTPFRSLILSGAGGGAIAALAGSGLVVSGADPRNRVRACAGAPDCASGLGPARAAAAALMAREMPADGLLHVSGCGKGCAHPSVAALVLTARADGSYRRGTGCRADGSVA